LVHILASLNETNKSVMLIGHNPAMEDLLVLLCGYSTVSKHQQSDGKIFTTANIVKLTTDATWTELVTDEIRLEKFLRPKEI